MMMRVRTVETGSPKMIEMAIGERNLAWPEAKNPKGVRPATVVMVVTEDSELMVCPPVVILYWEQFLLETPLVVLVQLDLLDLQLLM